MGSSDRLFRHGNSVPLQTRVTCPHCWEKFSPDRALWISQHPDLMGDPRLGRDAQQRFLPTRFNVAGAAVDARGFACHKMACPKCHLHVPRAMFEMSPFFLSILGAPACGKSYFLASMTWQFRRLLPRNFALSFGDADPELNHRLQEYESLQFLNPDPDAVVSIEKTQTHGDLYDTVLYSDEAVSYPRPFVFALSPLETHPSYASKAEVSHVLSVYDNAGESFLPGEDTAINPVTRHLSLSQAIMFLFDPTQDMRFRRACSGKTADPQMVERSKQLDRERPVRQDTILLEAAERVRRYVGLSQTVKHSRPLVMVVTKCDTWSSLLGAELPRPWIWNGQQTLCAMKLADIDTISRCVRGLLWNLSPEIVAAAESFAKQVIYIPVSATGHSPIVDPKSGAFGFRSREMNPIWVEVPLLYVLSRWTGGLVCHTKPKSPDAGRWRSIETQELGGRR